MAPSVIPTIYVFTSEQLPQLRAVVAARAQKGAEPIHVRHAEDDIATILEQARNRPTAGPVGMVVASDAAALEAISLGADEAVVLRDVDEPEVVAFLDRVRLRATLRRENERLSQDVAHAEKLTALGTLVAGVGHELNNPLSAITLTLELVRDLVMDDLNAVTQLKEYLPEGTVVTHQHAMALRALSGEAVRVSQLFEEISSATDHVAQLVRDLRVFSRGTGQEPSVAINPGALIEQALRLVRREIAAHGVIERDWDAKLPQIVGPRNRLTQVLTNLLVNAAHALAEIERPIHRVRVSVRCDEQFMAISVSDTGPGIPEESLERIFDPFYTTKREGLGTGLGLAISRATLRQLGGDLAVTSVFGEGATFICLVPLPTTEALLAASTWTPRLTQAAEVSSSLSVLLVDDDERVVRASARVLQERHRVLIARDGQEAIDLLSSGSQADVIVTELDVPECDGVQLYEWVLKNRPELAGRIVIATAAAERRRYNAFLMEYRPFVLRKPFGAEALLSAVERLAKMHFD